MRYLESERLLIKPIEEEDIYQLLEFRWDKDIMKYLVHEPISKQKQLAWFKSLSEKDLALSIFLKDKDKEKNELIGTIGLYNINRIHRLATWRIRLSPVVQGKGIGYEASYLVLEYAFSTLNLHKLQSTSFADNTAIIKLLHKLGCKEEGLLRSHYYKDGKYRDVVVFGLLKSDFLGAEVGASAK
jgi:RimJ/RimL family protein N-acetyltransferase